MDSPSWPIHVPELPSSQRERLFKEGGLVSIYEIFATIPDPRRAQGRRYELAYLLTCLVAAMLCGRNSTLAVAEWCRDEQALLEEVFGPRKYYCPDDSLYRKLLPRLDVSQVEGALADWIRMTLVASPDDPIALDGKTVRGAGTDEDKAPHLLSLRIHHSQETLLQIEVEEKTNEIPIALAYLPALPVAGRIFTADALHTHVPFFLRVQQLEGDVVLVAKDNQPNLHEHLATYFAEGSNPSCLATKMGLTTCVMSPFLKIAPAFAREMLHRSWRLCAIWSLRLFIERALLRFLRPDAPVHRIPSGLSLGCMLLKPLSFLQPCS